MQKSLTVRKTICQICNAECGMLVHFDDGRVVRVTGDPADPGGRGKLCIKGLNSPRILYAEDRLRYPLLRSSRREDFRRASWTEAMDVVGGRLERIRDEHGPQALALYVGTASRILDRMMMRRFARVFGTPNITSTWSICVGPKVMGYLSTFGVADMPWCDLRHARYILLWGTNPAVSQLHRYRAITADILAARKEGARLVVVDPRRTELAVRADLHLQIRPGTDLPLGLSMIQHIITHQLYDAEFVRRYTEGFDRLAAHVAPYTPQWAAEITDVPASLIERVAEEFARTRPASLERREGVQHNVNGTQTLRTMAILLAITGNVDVPGGLTFVPSQPLRDIPLPGDFPAMPAPFWHQKFPLAKDGSGYLPEVILSGEPYPIRALIVLIGNPLAAFPNTAKTLKAMNSLDLLVVHDLFMTETAELADVVLPAGTFFEKAEISPRSLRADYPLKLRRSVVEPRYEALSEWQFLCRLARWLGHGHLFAFEDEEALLDGVLRASGLTWGDFVNAEAEPPSHGRLLETGFATPTGKIELYSHLLAGQGYDPLPTIISTSHWTDSPDYPYYLVTGVRQRAYYHSQFRQIAALRKHHPEPLAEIGRAVAEEAGVGDGDWIEIRTRVGHTVLRAHVTDRVHPRTVIVPHGWPGAQNANWLTDDLTYDPVVGTPAYKEMRCSVRRT